MSSGGGYLKSKCSVEGVMVDVVSTIEGVRSGWSFEGVGL